MPFVEENVMEKIRRLEESDPNFKKDFLRAEKRLKRKSRVQRLIKKLKRIL